MPTANRASVLRKTLESLAAQSIQPKEIIVIDASEDDETKTVIQSSVPGLLGNCVYLPANARGAAIQRVQGIQEANTGFILFMDDDILLDAECIARLWKGMQSDATVGGVNAMIRNQRYHTPGRLSAWMYRYMHGKKEASYAGKCIGPAWNLLPEDRDDLPELVAAEWLNTTCTLYRREALPQPVFDPWFKGYSLFEDLCLSLRVGQQWKLLNARTARIFHDSQPGVHKKSVYALAKMEMLNRHYVMSRVMKRTQTKYYIKLFMLECWGVFTSLTSAKGWKQLLPRIAGKLAATVRLRA
jgi:glycosyltransferase involved in cell wall biosynthesis